MAKSSTSQRYILKLTTKRLARAKWNLSLDLKEARKNDELISIGDSQMVRWIDRLNRTPSTKERVAELRRQIRELKREPQSVKNRHRMRDLYDELDRTQFIPDYIEVVSDTAKNFRRACQGFTVNGQKFLRGVGTPGGIKNSTVIFFSERMIEALRTFIDNGRDKSKPMVPAKLEAYRALTCSTSEPVSWPEGVIVVKDCKTKFKEDVIILDDSAGGEPEIQYEDNYEVELTESDGYGLMMPSLAEKWSNELRLDYIMSGCNTRLAFEKGMVYTFDFQEWADEFAGGEHMVEDAWGDMRDIREAELILTTSQLKLWDSYQSLEDYLTKSKEYHYTFSIPKCCPDKLDNVRTLNYQFIQSYDLSDDDIDELIEPTMRKIEDVLTGDWRKAILFARGVDLNDNNVESETCVDCTSAMIVEPALFDDPYVKRRLYRAIETRIKDAKIGVLDVQGNYQMICGDPFALMQSIFKLPVTGILKAGEIYSHYWDERDVDEVACFRAPMSSMYNIKKMKVCRTDEARYWFRYMKTAMLLNAFDTMANSLNGAD